MNPNNVSYFIYVFVIAIVFYLLGKQEGIKEEKERHGIESWLEEKGETKHE